MKLNWNSLGWGGGVQNKIKKTFLGVVRIFSGNTQSVEKFRVGLTFCAGLTN